jgi:putative sigma-54 modulation protein
MKLVLSTHNLRVTQPIIDHIEDCIQKLERYDHRAVDARVTIEHDHTKAPERQFSCSVRLSVRGPDLFAEDTERTLDAAIDIVMKKIEQQIRKRQSRIKARKHAEAAKGKQIRRDKETESM